MDTRYASREAREHQLLLAAVRQLSRSRLADHTLPALALAGLSAALALTVVGSILAFGLASPLLAWHLDPLQLTLLVGAGAVWMLGAAGVTLSALALIEATGTKGLALLALVANTAASCGLVLALLIL
jgi:hypothetical protein